MNRRQFLQSLGCLGIVNLPFVGVFDDGRVLALDQATLGSAIDGHALNIGLLLDDAVLLHSLAEGHPESPARFRAIREQLVQSGVIDHCQSLPLRANIDEYLLYNHSASHINAIKELGQTHELVSSVTGGVLNAVDEIISGNIHRAFCATRPPGHHATNTGREEGFCFYNHVAIAAQYARRIHGIERVLIVDWDYHHGNGTEASFYADPSVLFFSTHDWMAYPLTGDPSRRGEGAGEGYNINVHLPCGADDQAFFTVFEEHLLPAVSDFKPEFVIISCGFDSRLDDLLGCHAITDQGYAHLTRMVCDIADQFAGGRVLSVLEGGYGISGTASASEAHLRALMG